MGTGCSGGCCAAAVVQSMLALLLLLVLMPAASEFAQMSPDIVASRASMGTIAVPRKLLAPGSQPVGVRAAAAMNSNKTPHKLGSWSRTIKFPLVPVAATMLHTNGKLLVWAANSTNASPSGTAYASMAADVIGLTATATYNPADHSVSAANISRTNHDMFCPGISTLPDGRIVVTGGESSLRTSIYDPVRNQWVSGPNMRIPRGYSSSAILSNGQVFTIGGSYSGGVGNKNGEVYTPGGGWRLLPGCPVDPILTKDLQGVYRSDNHAWLFGWSNGSVFHAGPSLAMHWFDATGNGSVVNASRRGSDTDAINGNAVMYDATAGNILTIGGAASYTNHPENPPGGAINTADYTTGPFWDNVTATSNAHVITIGAPYKPPKVRQIGNMAFPRAFANSVVLPDGKVLVVGGQKSPLVFTDGTSQLTPELWDPATEQFTKLARGTVPRTYHSTALLMPDASVFSGGGGLCGLDCPYNHFDGQVFEPPYLFSADGSRAQQPVITLAPSNVTVGSDVTVATDRPCPSFALVRYGTATHALDTDQRRVPLTPESLNPGSSPPSPLATADSAAASGGRRLTQQLAYDTAGGAVLVQGTQLLPDGSIVQSPAVQSPAVPPPLVLNPAPLGSEGEYGVAGEFAPALTVAPPAVPAPAPEAPAAAQPSLIQAPVLTSAPLTAPAPAPAPAPEASAAVQPAPEAPLAAPSPAPEPALAAPAPAPQPPAAAQPAQEPPTAAPSPAPEPPVAALSPAPEPPAATQPAPTPPPTAVQQANPCGPSQAGQKNGSCYSLSLPEDPGVLLPGYWMLFAMDANGVPSKAATMHVAAAT